MSSCWPATALLFACAPIVFGCQDFEGAPARAGKGSGSTTGQLGPLTWYPTTLEQMSRTVSNEGGRPGKPPTFGPLESTIWQVEVRLTSVQLLESGDYYFDAESPSGTLAAVVLPVPGRVKDRDWAARVTKARADVEKRMHPSAQRLAINQMALVDGMGRPGLAPGPDGKTRVIPFIEPALQMKWISR